MKFTLAVAALVGLAAASPQGVSASLAPSSTAPAVAATCSSTYNNGQQFQIGIVNQTAPASRMMKRLAAPDTTPGHTLELSLSDGTLKDQNGRVGYIAANGQLQFDNSVPQTGAQITTGWSACPNNTLALTSTIFYECLSGNFYNLYDKSLGSICYAVNLDIIGGSGTASSSVASSVVASSTAAATSVAASSAVASATSAAIVAPAPVTSAVASSAASATVTQASQVSDGQVQAPTNGTLAPYNPNGASAIFVSGSSLIVAAAAVGFSALLL